MPAKFSYKEKTLPRTENSFHTTNHNSEPSIRETVTARTIPDWNLFPVSVDQSRPNSREALCLQL